MAGLFLAAQGFAADWTPAQLGSSIVKNWYDAADFGTLWQDAGGTTAVTDNGQTVLRWTDKSGNGNHLTSVKGPAYTTSAMNGWSVLQFADSSFARTAGLAMGNITDNFTVIGVFNVTANNGWDNWIKWGNGGAGDPDVFVVSGGRAGGPAQGMEFIYDGGEGETTDAAVTGQPAFLFIGALDQVPTPNLFSVWKDGVSQGSRNPTAAYRTTPSASLSQFRIGIADSDGRNPNGDIAELLILNTGVGNLSQTDREKIEGYLANKWWGAGDANPLPSDHPYKNSAPATYTITASAGTGGTINQSGTTVVGSGQNVTLTITTNTGFTITDVTVDGGSVGAVTSYTFSDVQANHTIAASFTAIIPTFTITASAGTGGMINPSGATVVAQGQNQTFTITPSNAYAIADVTVDEGSVGAVTSYTFANVQVAHTIAAIFAAIPPPPVPTGLTATPGEGMVALAWSASTGASSYNVKRATVSGGPYTTIASPVSTDYTDPQVVNGTNYYYVVSAMGVGGESANSGEVSATPRLNASLWRPAMLGSSIVKNWYDSADFGTLWQDADGTTPVIANAQTVLRWDDKSGNGNHLTSGNGPAYTTGVMNSRPVLRFDSSSFARTTGLAMGNITDNFTVIGVFKVTANNGWDNWIKWGNGGAGDPDVFVVSGGRVGGPAQGMEFSYDGGEGETTDAAVTGQPAFLFVGALDQVPNPDLFSVWKDGVSQGSRNPTAAYQTTPGASLSQFRIGIADSNGRNPHGEIAELLILNTGPGNLSQADREMVEGYLANKWWGSGDVNPLPAGHPFKTTPPQSSETAPVIMGQPADQLVRPGGSATFSVTASGTDPLSYQWYYEGQSIDGATSQSYSINPVADFDAGGYSVVVSDSFGGSVTSRAASLTVLSYGGGVLGANFSTDCPDSAADRIGLSEVADGFQGWENVPIRTCAGQNLLPGTATIDGGVVTVSWAASAVWYDGSTANPDEKLFRIYLDDAATGNVTIAGLSTWLSEVTATNSLLDAYKVRLYWSANTGSSLASMEISDVNGSLLDTVQPSLPGYGTGVQRAMGDSAPLNNDTIVITWPARPADLSVRASLAAIKITAAASLEQPLITSEPADQLVRPGGSATFSVTASGSLPLSYQWFHAGTPIDGAIAAGYSINPVADSDAGGYSVVVANPSGNVISRVATLTTQGLIDWTPEQLGAGTVKNWYDADAANTLWQDAAATTPVTDSGQTVLAWADKSGNGNHLTSVNGPAYATGLMNGRPVLQFADSSFARTLALAMGNITDNFTVMGVFNVTANSGWDNWIRWGNGGAGDPDVFIVSGGRAGGPAQGMEFGYDGGEGETTDLAVTGQSAFLFAGALDQGVNPHLFSVWKDGVSHGVRNPTPAYQSTPSAALSQFRIGLADSNGRNPNGNIAELLILNTGPGNLAPADREKLEGYLAQKWWGAGDANPLPAGHPYKLSVPLAQVLHVDITRSAQGITITWPSGTLQSSTTLAPANWIDLPTATSPYPVNPANAATYYRVRQ